MQYKDSGVDINEGNAFVDIIKPYAKTTINSNVLSAIGGFSGLYDVSFVKEYKRPVLVSSTDGVGTKLELARVMQKFDTVGVDLVAMVVNDIAVQGAKPLFFLDYYASGKLKKHEAEEVIKGIVAGCLQANCSLIGGETAEMPGVYDTGKFDLAGFGVGIVEYDNILPKQNDMVPGDVLVGIPSSGLHSNGFSLVRKLIDNDKISLTLDMLNPTKIYVNKCIETAYLVKAFVHITGGGFVDNIPRVLPECLEASLCDWEFPDVFKIIQHAGEISKYEMLRTFNCGFGIVAVLNTNNVNNFITHYQDAQVIGELKLKK